MGEHVLTQACFHGILRFLPMMRRTAVKPVYIMCCLYKVRVCSGSLVLTSFDYESGRRSQVLSVCQYAIRL